MKGFVPKTATDFTLRFSKSYVPFTCKFPMVMHFVLILHKRGRSKTNFSVFSYDLTSFCERLRFVLAEFMEKFKKKICYLNNVRRRIGYVECHGWFHLQVRAYSSCEQRKAIKFPTGETGGDYTL